MELQFVIDRLKARLTGMKAIGGAADLDAAIAGTLAVPSVFVLPLADQAKALRRTSVTAQVITANVGLVQVVSNARDPRGEAAAASLAPVRQQVRAALIGWVPDADTGEPVTTTGGRLLKFDGDGRLWWIDEFQLVTFYRA